MRLKKEERGKQNSKKIILKIEGDRLRDGVGNIIDIPKNVQKYVDLAVQEYNLDGNSYIILRQLMNTNCFIFRPLKNITEDSYFSSDSNIDLCPELKNYLQKCHIRVEKQEKKKPYKANNTIKDGRELNKSMVDSNGNYNPNWTYNIIFGYVKGD